MKPERKPAWARYGVAIGSVLLGWLVREVLTSTVGQQRLPFIFFFPAIAFSAWFGGLWPSVLGTILAAAIADFYYLGPGHTLGRGAVFDTIAMASYFVSSAFIIGAMQAMHLAQKKLVTAMKERTKAETALAEETELLGTTLHSIGDAVLTTDPAGKVSFINREAERLTGWDSAEAAGQPLERVFRIIQENTREPAENILEKVWSANRATGVINHTILVSKAGKETRIDNRAAPIRRPDGSIGGAVLVFRDFSEKQSAERTSAWLGAIVEFSGDAILTKDLNGRIQSWNAGAERLFGYRPEEVIGKHVTVLFPPDRLKEEDRILSRLREGLAVERFETIRVTKEGRKIPVVVSISPIKDSEGRIIAASKIVQDMSELMETRQALEAEKELLTTTLTSIGDAVVVTDPAGIVRFLNREAERLTGWKTAEAAHRPLAEVFHIINEETREEVEDPAAKVLRMGAVVGLANHTVLLNRAGREIPIDDSAAPIRGEDGQLHGVVLVFRDFSERKRTEQQQQRLYSLVQAVNQARAMDQIYDAALDAICDCLRADRCSILLLDHGVMRFKAWRSLSEEYRRAVEGHSPWAPEAKEYPPVCIADTQTTEGELKEAFLREGIGALGFVPITYDGKLLGKFMVYYNQPHPFKQEELRLVATVGSQVAQAIRRRRTQEELETLVRERTTKLREMVGELQHVSYAITHDMRAPLRAMNTFAGLVYESLSARPEPSEELLDSCRRIMASASRLDQLIKDALNYTKAVLQEQPLRSVDLSKLIPSLIETYPNLQSDKADIFIEDRLPVVLGEESLLTQCFSNLLGNAVKFVKTGVRPQIHILVSQSAQKATIQIRDNGIGIAKESRRRLFGMFERLTAGYEGTGIGLAIVRKVVERMGGKVGAESEPGQGSCFWVELNLVPAQAESSHTLLHHGKA
jgi:PAS domain S-box-containing protein